MTQEGVVHTGGGMHVEMSAFRHLPQELVQGCVSEDIFYVVKVAHVVGRELLRELSLECFQVLGNSCFFRRKCRQAVQLRILAFQLRSDGCVFPVE